MPWPTGATTTVAAGMMEVMPAPRLTDSTDSTDTTDSTDDGVATVAGAVPSSVFAANASPTLPRRATLHASAAMPRTNTAYSIDQPIVWSRNASHGSTTNG